jgi:WD40 repeat protein
MKETRKSRLKEIVDWVANKSEKKDVLQNNTYWINGSPGIGKTSLAHSICARLHEQKQLAGAYFCRRDDPDLSKPKNVLPTLIYKLAEIFPHFRKIVADCLRDDPNLTPGTMKPSLFLDLLDNLRKRPNDFLVLVIDAFDECGDDISRPRLLKLLTDAATHASWLKIIITSRPEADIRQFFTQSSYLGYDLATDQEASIDLRTFARSVFDPVGRKRRLSEPWPEESLLDKVISRADGLFIFIKTLVLALKHCEDPTEVLKTASENSAGAGLEALYRLYSSILESRIEHHKAEFRRMIGVLHTAAPYRALREKTIAELAGIEPTLVEMWVDDLSSLLYRDEGTNGGIRVRHLSISDFLVSDDCPYQINHQDANVRLGIACLKTMVRELRFNICGLEDSRLANADIKDLDSRIKRNISDSLQYSSLYWSNHLCFAPNNDRRVWDSLEEFFEGLCPLFWIEVLSILGMVLMGAPSIRSVISWAEVSSAPACILSGSDRQQSGNSTVLERIQDVCRFIIAFRTPISISAPHTYLSTRPFLPLRSTLSKTFSTRFTKGIEVVRGRLSSWPAPPLSWVGHTSHITCLSYSPNGRQIVSGSDDMTIRIWDAETGAISGEPLKGHTSGVTSVAYSPDSRYIVSGSYDETIRVWDAETGAAVGKPLVGHYHWVWSVAYSPDGRHIISGSNDKTIRIWDTKTGAVAGNPLEGHTDQVSSVTYSPDGRYIISGSYDKTIRIWDAETGAAVGNPLEGHLNGVLSVAYSPNGRHIISGSWDKTIRIWDTETGAAVGKPLEGHSDQVSSIAYSPDGRYIISGSNDRTIRIWDAETGAVAGNPLEGHSYGVLSIAYSPDGQHVISGSYDKTIRIWDPKTGAAAGTPLEGHSDSVMSVAYSPNGRHIISASCDKTVRIWDAETGAAAGKPLEGHSDHVWSVAYSPDGRHIISGSRDKTIRIWDGETGASVGKPLEGHGRGVSSVAYSPDGRHIISGSYDKTIRIWDTETSTAVGEPLVGHYHWVSSIAHSPDRRHIISGSYDKTIRIWDTETGTAVGKPLEGHSGWVSSVTYSPDGRHIISGSDDKTIRIWDAETGAAVGKPLEGHSELVLSFACSPDGRHIISGSYDNTIRTWDAETGAAIGKPLEGHSDGVLSVAYSPDGRYIISGSGDKTIRIWDAETNAGVGGLLKGDIASVLSVASSPNGQHIVSASNTNTIHFSGPFEHQPSSSSNPLHAHFYSRPDSQGWVRDSDNGLLYWVPLDCRGGLHSPSLITIPPTSHVRTVCLDFEDFAFGTAWPQIFNSCQR